MNDTMLDFGKVREPFGPPDEPLRLDNLNHNLPSSPIIRSLSKSNLRDPSQKHPPPPRAQVKDRAEDDISVQPLTQIDDTSYEHAEEHPLITVERPRAQSCSPIEKVPSELLEWIIGHVAGQLGAAGLGGSSERHRNWNDILRHPRGKNIRELAQVSSSWRTIVQKRLFRHIKVQSTQAAITELGDFFLSRPHLQCHVRHLQVLIPIWEKNGDDYTQRYPSYIMRAEHRPSQGYILLPNHHTGVLLDQRTSVAQNFKVASKNASLSEIFASAQGLFPELYALTVESGHCQRPPQIKYFPTQQSKVLASQPPRAGFRIPSSVGPYLPKLLAVKVLILKGTWNIVRQFSELDVILNAVPNANEFHCSYHSFMPQAYTTICKALQTKIIKRTIKHLNFSLEGFYKDPTILDKWRAVYPENHLCRAFGATVPFLYSMKFTGRLCGALFSEMTKAAETILPSTPRLRSIEILVQNTCRGPRDTSDGVGIHNYRFIQAFEIIIFQAVRALRVYQNVDYVHIRFLDIDAPDPPIQPVFNLRGKKAWGFWSDRIYEELLKTRPDVEFDTGFAYPTAPAAVNARGSHHIDFYRSIAESLVGTSVV